VLIFVLIVAINEFLKWLQYEPRQNQCHYVKPFA